MWWWLTTAVAAEVCATVCLRVASVGRRRLYPAVGVGYIVAFACLSGALDAGMGLGLAYGVWTAAGVALVALASKVLFGEQVSRRSAVGVALIVLGVFLIEAGATAPSPKFL